MLPPRFVLERIDGDQWQQQHEDDAVGKICATATFSVGTILKYRSEELKHGCLLSDILSSDRFVGGIQEFHCQYDLSHPQLHYKGRQVHGGDDPYDLRMSQNQCHGDWRKEF